MLGGQYGAKNKTSAKAFGRHDLIVKSGFSKLIF